MPERSIACLIPSRGGSKRFPRKNVALLKGKPLLAYSIDAARQSGLFPDVWVSTEDVEIAKVAEEHGARVHHRSPELATDHATMVQVGLEFLDVLERTDRVPEVLCIVLATAALLDPDDLHRGLRLMTERDVSCVMAVTTYLEPPVFALEEVGGCLRPFFGRTHVQPGSKYPRLWVDSGSFYLVGVQAFRRHRTFYGSDLVGLPIPRWRSVDIDEPEHLRIAEALMDYKARSAPSRP